ncbi:DNA-3-methyladenine glycosylase [Plebeiibacterium sediminum]|uniref:Putative 3-methyladenine DNA glycosylase n=1 Tax=Plebeiibacterium sediminum TaxID=2992112 RepID=A0AAE3SI29_9BACT|nr:DNA-3-methyladenine glycosylase [Plebeiobacterium sediminum]MCW3788748.1 DNA-3-methyladenine glycosylase [Plebeiobacterium sediminum]
MKLDQSFFLRNALDVAPELIGKKIVRIFEGGIREEFIITEVEAYCGQEDLACHASKGRTQRTEVMFHQGGKVYVYLIYGMYWMLNFVCGDENDAQAVLIRGVKGISGPGRLGKRLALDKSFYGEDLSQSKRIWLENGVQQDCTIQVSKRIGVEYAGELWGNKLYRFYTDL